MSGEEGGGGQMSYGADVRMRTRLIQCVVVDRRSVKTAQCAVLMARSLYKLRQVGRHYSDDRLHVTRPRAVEQCDTTQYTGIRPQFMLFTKCRLSLQM